MTHRGHPGLSVQHHLCLALIVAATTLACAGCESLWPRDRALYCGDGQVDEEELCDGQSLQGMTCERLVHLGFEGGTLKCGKGCRSFDTSGCYKCRDGKKNGPTEVCDESALDGKKCTDFKFDGGKLACSSDCKSFNTSGCFKCGDGKKDPPAELCDGSALGGKSCAGLGFDGGALSCEANCRGFNTSGCFKCGDGKINGTEQCDGAAVGQADCKALGHEGGSIKCKIDCTGFDITGCYKCGDQLKNGLEQCDGIDLGQKTCKDLGFFTGTLKCSSDCKSHDTSGCQNHKVTFAVAAGAKKDDCGAAVAVDSSGNTIVVGDFRESIKLGGASLASAGNADVVVAKLDAAGKFLWAVAAGGPDNDYGNGVAVAAGGEVYITGTFVGTATFGSTKLTAAGNKVGYSDIFVAKLDKDGKFLWAVSAGGSSYDYGNGIALTKAGNVHIAGAFRDQATFGTQQLSSKGYTDIFTAKLSSDGKFLWAVGAGDSGSDSAEGVAVDGQGNSHITGYYRETLQFSSSKKVTASKLSDIFVAKLDATGSCLWVTSAGGKQYDYGDAIAVDSKGFSYITGTYTGKASFGAKELTTSKVAADLFVARLDSSGKILWGVRAGGVGIETPYGIAAGSTGDSWITGRFQSTATFGGSSVKSSGKMDIFIARLDSSGGFKWAARAGGSTDDQGSAVALDSAGAARVVGCFRGSATFGQIKVSSNGNKDLFVAKLDSAP